MNVQLEEKTAAATRILRRVAHEFSPSVLASSFGAEDMVLIDMIAEHGLAISVFTLDTGRLPEQTHALMQQASERYGLQISVYFPDAAALEDLSRNQGTNGFYRSVPMRKACCDVRKVEPLGRALAGKKAWVTGLRREQATTRQDVGFESFDAGHGLAKFNPLADWSDKEVWHYIHARQVPYNSLHDQGYASIGCAPCTRAITPGEDPRAGRWWWENPETRECGLHLPKTIPIVAALPRLSTGSAS